MTPRLSLRLNLLASFVLVLLPVLVLLVQVYLADLERVATLPTRPTVI